MFKEPKKKFTLLSLLSALVVVSTAFAGISIYAQTDDSMLTTSGNMTNATSDDAGAHATDETMTAEVQTLFEGMVICDVGTSEVSGETEVAAFDNATLTTPSISVTLMTETEVAEVAANETETASADETEVASASCIRLGGGDETSTSNATESTDATSNASDATPANNATVNATGTDDSELTTFEEEAIAAGEVFEDMTNATSDDLMNATTDDGGANTTSDDGTNATSTATTSAIDSEQQILVIEGQDFVAGEVVLVFADNNLVAIDDVDSNGEIEAKVPVTDPESQLRLVESGTTRTAEFFFDGETLLPSDNEGEIEVEGADDEATPALAPVPSNTTSTANSTSSNSTVQ